MLDLLNLVCLVDLSYINSEHLHMMDLLVAKFSRVSRPFGRASLECKKITGTWLLNLERI
eukprot:SAG31_NODE_2194_length_6224_cov_3.140408_1_plen_60_part_00